MVAVLIRQLAEKDMTPPRWTIEKGDYSRCQIEVFIFISVFDQKHPVFITYNIISDPQPT